MASYNVEKVKEQAEQVKDIFTEFLGSIPESERLEFLGAFHLRPTSSDGLTIVSTLECAPMRGISIKPAKLSDILPKLCEIAVDPLKNNKLSLLRSLGFEERKTESDREEDAQAAFIRDVVIDRFDGFTFVASEFDLFGVGDKNETKRPDVLVYRDGVIYDIELKNKRNGPKDGESGYSPITQAEQYVAHMKAPGNFAVYTKCLRAFPNSEIAEISDIRGVALVPASNSGRSNGVLEKAAKERSIELWEFDKAYRIKKILL